MLTWCFLFFFFGGGACWLEVGGWTMYTHGAEAAQARCNRRETARAPTETREGTWCPPAQPSLRFDSPACFPARASPSEHKETRARARRTRVRRHILQHSLHRSPALSLTPVRNPSLYYQRGGEVGVASLGGRRTARRPNLPAVIRRERRTSPTEAAARRSGGGSSPTR